MYVIYDTCTCQQLVKLLVAIYGGHAEETPDISEVEGEEKIRINEFNYCIFIEFRWSKKTCVLVHITHALNFNGAYLSMALLRKNI